MNAMPSRMRAIRMAIVVSMGSVRSATRPIYRATSPTTHLIRRQAGARSSGRRLERAATGVNVVVVVVGVAGGGGSVVVVVAVVSAVGVRASAGAVDAVDLWVCYMYFSN
jgi:hypothetical protein